MAFKSDLVDVGPPPYPIVPLPVAPLGVLRSIQPTPEQKAAVLAAVRGQPAPAGTAPPPPLVNKSTKTSTPQRNSTLGGTTALFEQLTQINELRNLLEASRRQLASEQASRAAVESQLTALRTQRTEKDLDEFILDPPLVADLRAELAAAQAKCTALEQENERLRRMSELLSQFETRAEEADLENVKLKAAAGEGERSRSELMDKLAASAARLEQKEAALVALQREKKASESTAQEHALDMAEEVRTAQQCSATLQEELDRAKADLAQAKSTATQRTAELKQHQIGFSVNSNNMYRRWSAAKKTNGDLKAQQAQECEKLSAANATIATLERRVKEANDLNAVLTAQRVELVQELTELQAKDGAAGALMRMREDDSSDDDDSSDEAGAGKVDAAGAEANVSFAAPVACKGCDNPRSKRACTCGRKSKKRKASGGDESQSNVAKKAKVPPTIVSANTVKAFIALLKFLDDVTEKVTDLRNNKSLDEDARVHLLESTRFGPFHLSVPKDGEWKVKDACEWGVDHTNTLFQGRRISRSEYMRKFFTTATQDCRGTGVHQAGLRFLQNDNGVQTEDYVQCMLGHTADSLYTAYASVHGDKLE